MIQIALIVAITAFFFVLERVLPGRELPESPGWYLRAAFLNACQISLVLLAGAVWNHWFQRWSLFHMAGITPEALLRFERGQVTEFGSRKLLAVLAVLGMEMTFTKVGTSGSLDELRRERGGA